MSSVIANTIVYIPPQQSPLVNTSVLGSQTTRVLADNVAPSVSNAQVDNNARGNGGAFTSSPSPAQTAPDSSAQFNLTASAQNAPSVNTPSAFLAQLLAQSNSSDNSITQSILVGYEQLVSISNVKYKPSNALKPSDDLSGVFGRILQQEQPAQSPEAQIVAPSPAPIPAAPERSQAQVSIIASNGPALLDSKDTNDNAEQTEIATIDTNADSPLQTAPAPSPALLPGLASYQATGARNDLAITASRDNLPAEELSSLV